MTTPPTGGPATINGVLYQMLWSLLRALKVHVRECDRSPTDGAIERAILILEPRGGGGDVQEVSGRRRVVEQLKAKSDGGTWSLREVVQEVLPDLYLARDPEFPDTEYRFVTEGRMGRWRDHYSFFKDLNASPEAGRVILEQFDDRKALFEIIVETVRKRQLVADRETVEQTREGVWELLANFTFVPEMTMDAVCREVDTILLALVARRRDVPEKRLAMLGALAEQATRGGAQIDALMFLKDFFLDSTPLTAWAVLRHRAVECLEDDLRRAGYDPDVDVRAARVADLAGRWQPSTPLLVVAGESGVGKSWLLYALASCLASGEGLIILTDATGDGDADCQRAADIFWKRIKGNEDSRSLDRTAARRRELVHPNAEAWLTVLIDGVRSHQEARQLARQPFKEWKVRIACTCLPEVARTLKAEARDHCQLHEVGDFSLPQLHRYLDLRHEGTWGSIPADVRQTLRRPLLARVYSDLAAETGWVPSNEYELYSRCWRRLREGEQGDYPLDVVPLHRLALGVLGGYNYPWSLGQLHAAGLTHEAKARLCRAGWLQPTAPSHYQVWHDRLLNWAVAEALCEQYDAGEIEQSTLSAHLRQLLYFPFEGVARPLGYVPMDVLWLLADPARGATDVVQVLIEALEVAP